MWAEICLCVVQWLALKIWAGIVCGLHVLCLGKEHCTSHNGVIPKLFHASHPYSANCFTFSLWLELFSVEKCMFLPWAATGYVISIMVLFFLKCLYVKSSYECAIWAASMYCVTLAFNVCSFAVQISSHGSILAQYVSMAKRRCLNFEWFMLWHGNLALQSKRIIWKHC